MLARPITTETLAITFDRAGPMGNALTHRAVAAVVSGPGLNGGGQAHVWESGADGSESYTIEIGLTRLPTSMFFPNLGTVMECPTLEMCQEGPANVDLRAE